MKRVILVCVFAAVVSCLLTGCQDKASGSVVVEEVKTYKPNLPPVPTISKPSVPETYPDGAFSIYGLRKKLDEMIDTQVAVTAYVVQIYKKPECPEGKTCVALMPHLYLADEKGETLKKRFLRLVGYASNFKEMEEEQAAVERGKTKEETEQDQLMSPIVWDWREGHKYKITGNFSRQSGAGFMETDGLLEYVTHQCLDCPAEEEKKEGENK